MPSNAKLKVDGSFVDKYIRLVLKDSDLDLFPLNDLNWEDTCFVQKKLNQCVEKAILKGFNLWT